MSDTPAAEPVCRRLLWSPSALKLLEIGSGPYPQPPLAGGGSVATASRASSRSSMLTLPTDCGHFPQHALRCGQLKPNGNNAINIKNSRLIWPAWARRRDDWSVAAELNLCWLWLFLFEFLANRVRYIPPKGRFGCGPPMAWPSRRQAHLGPIRNTVLCVPPILPLRTVGPISTSLSLGGPLTGYRSL